MAEWSCRNFHLLLVEDDADLREVFAAALKLKGYIVDCAEGGTRALAMMRRRGGLPDLVITDLQMPSGDGWALRQDMLADEELASVPVVVVSATSETKESLKVAAYLKKPVKLDSLLSAIEGCARH